MEDLCKQVAEHGKHLYFLEDSE